MAPRCLTKSIVIVLDTCELVFDVKSEKLQKYSLGKWNRIIEIYDAVKHGESL